jgi:hypothetical protein
VKDNMSIDERLNTSQQATVAKAVALLPDEQVSMVWRSDLNQVLRAKSQANKKRKFFVNFLSPVAGLGVACALAVVVLISPPQTHQSITPASQPTLSPSSLEASLVRFHQDDVRSADVAGTGLNPTEAINDTSRYGGSDDDGYDDDSELF